MKHKKQAHMIHPLFHFHPAVCLFIMLLSFAASHFANAQEQTIELKQPVVEAARSSSGLYAKNDTMESLFQAELPGMLNRAITQKMKLPYDMRMFDWTLTGGLSVEMELNTAVSIFWNSELTGRWKMTEDAPDYYRKSGLTFDISEQSLEMKNSFDAMQVFEKFWQFAKNRIRVYRYDYAGPKKKNQSAWLIAVRNETGKETSFHFTLLSTGMVKPLTIDLDYKNLFIEEDKSSAPEETFGVEFGLWHEQYTIDKSTYSDILITVCAEKNDNGLLIVLRYMEDDYLGHGVFNYLETTAK